jgi:hypothetical protein
MSSNASTNREFMDWLADIFKEVDWLIPAYVNFGFLVPLARAVKEAPQDAKLEILRHNLAAVYTPEYLAGMYLDRYSKVLLVRDFDRQIDESIRTYFCGYTFNAVTGMLPVIEGIIRKIASRQNRDVGKGTEKLNDELQALVDREKQSDHCYSERLVMLEVFRDFVRYRLLEKTDRYEGFNEFNRHGILHGTFEDFGQDINFFRLITLLDLLCFSIRLVEGYGSMFGPEPTPESSKLASDYKTLRSFHNHGGI